MAYITGSVTDGLGTLPFSLSAGTQLTMNIQNPLVGASYYGLETFLNQDGFYTSATPKNLSGSFILGSGITDIVYDNYKMVAVVQPGGGTLTYTPAININANTLATKGTGANLGKGDFATLLANGFSTRVTRDGGIVEDPEAITNDINSQPLLQNASYLMIPSGYKAGTLYSELSTNNYGDLTWIRASSGSRLNNVRVVENMGINVPRLDYTYGTDPTLLLEPQRTNSLRNSTMVGTIPGKPGTDPTNWQTDLEPASWIVGIGSENGLNYIDYRISGSSSGSIDLNIRFESTTQISASNGQTWTSTFYAKLVSGNTGSGKIVNTISECNAGVALSNNTSSITLNTSSLDRFTFTRTNTNASTTRIRNSCDFYAANDFDFTIRLAAPQMELGTFASTFIPTTSIATTRNIDGCQVTGVSSAIGQTEGVVFFDIYFTQLTNAGFRAFGSLEGNTANQLSGFTVTTTNNGNDVQYAGGSYNLTTGRHKIACTYSQANNQRKLFVDGVLRGTSTHTNFLATIDRLSIGCRINSFSSFTTDRPLGSSNGISIFALFNSLLTDNQCVALTTL